MKNLKIIEEAEKVIKDFNDHQRQSERLFMEILEALENAKRVNLRKTSRYLNFAL